MSLTCFAYACEHKFDHRQVGKKRIFHRLPKNVKLAKEWLRLSRANADLKQFGSIRLCSDHFHPSQYHGTHLIKDAVPSIFSWSNGSKDSEESVVPSSTVESNVPFGTHDEEVSVLTIEPSCTDVEQANGYRTNLTSPSIIPSQTNERFLSKTLIRKKISKISDRKVSFICNKLNSYYLCLALVLANNKKSLRIIRLENFNLD